MTQTFEEHMDKVVVFGPDITLKPYTHRHWCAVSLNDWVCHVGPPRRHYTERGQKIETSFEVIVVNPEGVTKTANIEFQTEDYEVGHGPTTHCPHLPKIIPIVVEALVFDIHHGRNCMELRPDHD